jgi:ATP/ADP translocase
MGLTGLSAAFLFCGYEFIRSPAESLFIAEFGSGARVYALACVPFAMALLIYLYGRALSALGPRRAMLGSMGVSLLFFVAAFIALKSGVKAFAFLLFVFKESYVVIIAEAFWSFINSTLKEGEGRAWNGPVSGLGALGSVVGAFLISRYAVAITTEPFILFCGLLMLPAMLFTSLAYREAGESRPEAGEAGGRQGHLHLGILRENRTVLFIALIIFCTQVVSTVLDLNFARLVQAAFPAKDVRTAWLGSFWMNVNLFSFGMQFVVSPILLRLVPIRAVQVAIPLVHVVTAGILLFHPQLGMAAAAFLLFKGLDYSIFRASKETLYVPFSWDTRYRAKQVADAFTYRFSKGFTAITLSALGTVVAIPVAFYAGCALVVSTLWTTLAFPLTASRDKRTGN